MIFVVFINAQMHPVPELIGLISNQASPEGAVVATLKGEWDIDVEDVAVECLSERADCWYQQGPERMQ